MSSSSKSVHTRPGFKYSAETTIDLPLSSDVLFITTTNVGGPTMSSTLDIEASKSPNQLPNVTTVRVVTFYNREDIFKGTKVSLVRRAEGQNGVDVSVSDWAREELERHVEDGVQLFFEIIDTFPELAPPVVIKRFETDVHDADQKVGDLKDKVSFQSLYLTGHDGRINVGSLKTDQGKIETHDGDISGHFNVSEKLNVETHNGTIDGQFNSSGDLTLSTHDGSINGQFSASKHLNLTTHDGDIKGQIKTSGEINISTHNGEIQVDVELTSNEGSLTKVTMDSHNGAIETNLSLVSSSKLGGSFEASTTTSDGRLDVKFPVEPVDSKLKFVGKTKNGKATIFLNPAYEGTFNLESKTFSPTVDEKQVEDPSGQGRKRELTHTEEDKVVMGQVYWKDEAGQSKVGGTVDVETRHGKLVLTL